MQLPAERLLICHKEITHNIKIMVFTYRLSII